MFHHEWTLRSVDKVTLTGERKMKRKLTIMMLLMMMFTFILVSLIFYLLMFLYPRFAAFLLSFASFLHIIVTISLISTSSRIEENPLSSSSSSCFPGLFRESNNNLLCG